MRTASVIAWNALAYIPDTTGFARDSCPLLSYRLLNFIIIYQNK